MELEPRRSVLGTAGLRRFDWDRSPAVLSAGSATAGGASSGSTHAPGSLYPAHHITLERTKTLALPPHPHIHKKLESRLDGTAAFDLNGQRVGELTAFLDRDAALDRAPGKSAEVRDPKPFGAGFAPLD